MTDGEISELERLADAATPGEWRAQETNVGIMCKPRRGQIHPTLSCFIVGIAPDNARAIAATHNALPSLIAALRTERARTARLAKLLGEARIAIRGPQGTYKLNPGDHDAFETKDAWEAAWQAYRDLLRRIDAELAALKEAGE